MANLKELRGRIGSIKNTRKITSAMSRIAAARLSRAQNAVLAARPYGERLNEVVGHLLAGLAGPSGVGASALSHAHPMLEQREVRRVLLIAMNADRGLCGGFNANVNKAASRLLEEQREAGVEVDLVCVGRKSQAFFKHLGEPMRAQFAAPAAETAGELSRELVTLVTEAFTPSTDDAPAPVDRVILVHNRFVSVLTQEVRTPQLLPILAPAEPEGPAPTFEPSSDELLAHLLPVFLEATVHQAMLDSMAAEVAARRMAMDSATDNATELIGELTLEYNRERQAAITKELMEIIGGAEALGG